MQIVADGLGDRLQRGTICGVTLLIQMIKFHEDGDGKQAIV